MTGSNPKGTPASVAPGETSPRGLGRSRPFDDDGSVTVRPGSPRGSAAPPGEGVGRYRAGGFIYALGPPPGELSQMGREHDGPSTRSRRRGMRWSVLALVALFLVAGLTGLTYLTGPAAARSAPVVFAAAPRAASLSEACVSPACGPVAPTLPTSAVAASRPALLGTTPSNWLVANWSGEGMIAQNPTNPLDFVAGSLYQAPAVVNNSTVYNDQGVSGVFTSFDGGHSWHDSPLPACEFHIADTAVAFGPNDHVYYIDMGYTTTQTGCPYSTSGYGVFVTTSLDGGMTWGTPVPVRGNGSTSLDKPWTAVDATTGEVYVAYTDDGAGSQIYIQNSTDNGTTWSSPLEISGGTDSQRGVELVVDRSGAIDASWVDQTTAQVEFARSVDHGHSFSTPVIAGVGATEYGSPSPDTFRAYMLPGLGLDAHAGNAYDGRLFLVWQNGSGGRAGSPFVSLSYSDDNGSHWSKPLTVNSDRSLEDFQPSVAIDPAGTVYVVWYGVNATSGHYRLLGAVSHNGGTSFDPEFPVSDTDSYPHYANLGYAWWIGDYTDLIANAGGALPLWTDARSTQEWSCSTCIWGYDYNISMYTAEIVNVTLSSNVATNLSIAGTVPTNASWSVGVLARSADWLVGQRYNLSAPAVVNDNGSTFHFASWFGAVVSGSENLSGVVNASFQLQACYSETLGGVCRAPGAPGFLGIVASPPNATTRLDGVLLALPNGTTNLTLSPGAYWVNVSAPGFHGLSVLETVSTANVTTVYANLTPYPGVIAGLVDPTSANVTIDGHQVPVLAANGSFVATVAPGVHAVVVSQHLYSTYFTNVTVRTNATTAVVAHLSPTWGVLTGVVSPASASATLNGRPLSTTNGAYRVELAAGTYWVNASLAGYANGTSGPQTVATLATVVANLYLSLAYGTLNGTVSPLTAALAFNGSAVGLVSGTFSIVALPGVYWLNASASGYDPLDQQIVLYAETTRQADLALNASVGWVTGTISPVGATLEIATNPIAVGAGGSFNASLPAGTYRVVVSASGWTTQVTSVNVASGYATIVHYSLSPPAASSSNGSSWYLPLGLGAIAIAAVAVVLLVLVRRRGRPRPPSGRPPATPRRSAR